MPFAHERTEQKQRVSVVLSLAIWTALAVLCAGLGVVTGRALQRSTNAETRAQCEQWQREENYGVLEARGCFQYVDIREAHDAFRCNQLAARVGQAREQDGRVSEIELLEMEQSVVCQQSNTREIAKRARALHSDRQKRLCDARDERSEREDVHAWRERLAHTECEDSPARERAATRLRGYCETVFTNGSGGLTFPRMHRTDGPRLLAHDNLGLHIALDGPETVTEPAIVLVRAVCESLDEHDVLYVSFRREEMERMNAEMSLAYLQQAAATLATGFSAMQTRFSTKQPIRVELWHHASPTPAHLQLTLKPLGDAVRGSSPDPSVAVTEQRVQLIVEAMNAEGVAVANTRIESDDTLRFANGEIKPPAFLQPEK